MLLMSASTFICHSENRSDKTEILTYNIETRASFAGGENTPFWLVSNIQGLGSPELNNGFVRGDVIKHMDSGKRFSWGAGADIAVAWNLPENFSIRQLYGELHYRALWVSIGSRNYFSEYNDRYLSSGDLLFSGNAMAIPQFRIGIKDFTPIWGTKNLLSIRGYLAYGAFTDTNWLKRWVSPGTLRPADVLFCSRGLWFRVGDKKKFPLTYDIGIEMGTQFGGKIHKGQTIINMPSKLIDWLKAFIPLAGNPDTPEDEQTNVQGNMTGEYSMNLSYSPNKDWNIRAYWEHYFEDHSQMTFEYGVWKDGLWGVELIFPSNPFISKFVYEYICTKDQTGSVLHNWTPEIPEQVSGQDGYFAHYLYGGWQNWGMGIGTPLAISPLYNRSHELYMYNTRFIAHHIGIEGNPYREVNWRLLLTYSKNWGSYFKPLPNILNNFSGLVEADYYPAILKGGYVKAALAWDKGKLLGNNFGGMITFGYEGKFTF